MEPRPVPRVPTHCDVWKADLKAEHTQTHLTDLGHKILTSIVKQVD